MQVVVLEKDELADLLRQAANLAVSKLRDDLESKRTPELMSKEQLAVYLDVHISTIDRYMKKGIPIEHAGDLPRFRKNSIDLWLKRKQ
jgi:hypothetical protein